MGERHRGRWLLLALGLAGAGWVASLVLRGRSAGDGSVVPVEGRVLVNGKPLAIEEGQIGKVWFYPASGGQGSSSSPPYAEIGRDGCYNLSTGGKPGVPPGRYRVMLIATAPSDPKRPFHRRRSLIPPRYCAVETSGLVVEVVANPPAGAYDLRLKK
jgi:hypothetical protein